MRFITFAANGLPIFNTGAQTVTYGSPYILRVDVHNGAGAQCSPDLAAPTTPPTAPCPTGTVNLTDNGSPLKDFIGASGSTGTTTLNSQGYLEDQPIQLPASTTPHSLAAAYLGDNSYNASTSSALSVTINQATTTTALLANPTSIASGGTVTLTATVNTTSNGDAPCDGTANTGTVQFSNGSTPLSGTVSYTGTSGAASSTGAASCVATLTTTLAMFPPPLNIPRTPNIPRIPLFLLGTFLALFLLLLRWTPRTKRRYAYAGFAALALLAIGFAGCSGPSSGSGGGHNASITAKYSGDTNYSGSTSAATPVTIH